jgi:hypothetical protein
MGQRENLCLVFYYLYFLIFLKDIS